MGAGIQGSTFVPRVGVGVRVFLSNMYGIILTGMIEAAIAKRAKSSNQHALPIRTLPAMLVLFALVPGCLSIYVVGKPMQRSELFFGLSIPGGKQISEAQWQAFVDDTITQRFPDGFTVVDGAGQWRESSGNIVHERSKILVILHNSDVRTFRKMDEIRDEYKRRFHQEAVIRETEDAQVSF